MIDDVLRTYIIPQVATYTIFWGQSNINERLKESDSDWLSHETGEYNPAQKRGYGKKQAECILTTN